MKNNLIFQKVAPKSVSLPRKVAKKSVWIGEKVAQKSGKWLIINDEKIRLYLGREGALLTMPFYLAFLLTEVA